MQETQIELPTDRLRVVVAVLTYRRPGDLADILPTLEAQILAQPAGRAVRLLVIDNDPAAGARDQVEAFAAGSPIDVAYEHEAVPGIAAARNRALSAAADDRVLVYIDDDERPTDGWLDLLLGTWAQTGSTAVVGPVVSTFAAEPDAFVTAGRFFDRRRLPTGTAIDVAATNNLLLDLEFVRTQGLEFALDLGTAGGSDTLLTRQLIARGGSMVWCDEAVVIDVVPADRVTRDWNLRRALRSGNSWSVTSLRLAGGRAARLRVRSVLIARGAVRVVGGGARMALGAVTRDAGHHARGLRSIMRGSGMLSGAIGYTYREYARKSA